MPTQRLTTGYWAWMTALMVLFFALPVPNMVVWALIGLTSAGAVITGVFLNKPRLRLPWWLMAAGILTFTAGDTVFNVLTDFLGQEDPFPSLADACYLATFPLIALALIGLVRTGSAGVDRDSLVDALILTLGLGLLSWIFLIAPFIHRPELTVLGKAVAIGYPVGDVLVLATAVRLFTTTRRMPAVILLSVGALALLISDTFYGRLQIVGEWKVGGPVDLGWIIFYATWGAAALHPSMKRLTEPRIVRPVGISAGRLAALTLATMIAPAVLLVDAIHHQVRYAGAVAIFSAGLFLLVLIRLAGVANRHRRALARESGLRGASTALLSATDPHQVHEAIRTAIRRLLPDDLDHQMVLSVPADPPPPNATPVWTGYGNPSHTTQLWHRADLEPAIAAQLDDFDFALRCPLAIDDRPVDEPQVGTLYLAAEERAMIVLPRSLEVLASQAALALERISLSREVTQRESEAYFRTLVQNTSDIILIVSDDDRIRYASPSATGLLGSIDFAGMALTDLVDAEDQEQAQAVLRRMRLGQTHTESADWTVCASDGSRLQVEVSTRDLRQDPTVQGVVITLRDVTQRRRLEQELVHRAFHDSLTGLANRVLFAERVQQAVIRARRTRLTVGVLMIDLDDFKVINETMGHEAGDRLLIAVGRRLGEALREHDTAARLGGDEFATLIEDASGPGEIEQVAERLIAVLSQPFSIAGQRVGGAASVGVATTADATDGQELLRQADLALYVAKSGGKGQWRRYQPALHNAMVDRLELRAALEQSVGDNAFVLRYQPIVALATGEAVGYEALLRWNHPTHGLIAPGEFIDVAEESGLIVPIGTWALRQSMADAVQWQRSQDGLDRYLSVNVSVRQFRSAGFLQLVWDALASSGLPASSLVLEITESLLMGPEDDEVLADLGSLRAAGVRVAIDDFGTGYSSLSYLRKVPVDILKIDKTFVDTLASSPQQHALVEGIIRLAETLGLQVVAEGVEHTAERDLLQQLGCPLGQGYLYAQPMSYGEAVTWQHAIQIEGDHSDTGGAVLPSPVGQRRAGPTVE